MSSRFINGAKYAVSTQIAAAVAVTAISNANPAVASSATPPPNGSVGVMNSNWSELQGVPFRSQGATSNSFQLEDVDTSDVNRYPAGEGAGAFQIVSGWTSITQVRSMEPDGGEQNYFEYQYIDDPSNRIRRKPTTKSAQGWTMTLDYDPDLPWYETLIELDRKQEQVMLRETLPNGEVIYYYGYISFNKVPSKTPNENMTVQVTFSLDTDPVRFPAP